MSENQSTSPDSIGHDKSCRKCLRKAWRIFRLLIPVMVLVYLGLVLRAGWNADKGAARFFDAKAVERLRAAGCEELGKLTVPEFDGAKNIWLFRQKDEVALYIAALENKPECLALGVLAWTPTKDDSADSIKYFYDEETNLPIAKVTIEYLNPRRR